MHVSKHARSPFIRGKSILQLFFSFSDSISLWVLLANVITAFHACLPLFKPLIGQLENMEYQNLSPGVLQPKGFGGKKDGFFKTPLITEIMTNQTIQGRRHSILTDL